MQPEYENRRLSISNLLPLRRYVIFFFIYITRYFIEDLNDYYIFNFLVLTNSQKIQIIMQFY